MNTNKIMNPGRPKIKNVYNRCTSHVNKIWHTRNRTFSEWVGNNTNTTKGTPHSLDRLVLRGGDACGSSSLPLSLELPLPDSESLKTLIRSTFQFINISEWEVLPGRWASAARRLVVGFVVLVICGIRIVVWGTCSTGFWFARAACPGIRIRICKEVLLKADLHGFK